MVSDMEYPVSSSNDTIWKGLFLEKTILIILKDSDFELIKSLIFEYESGFIQPEENDSYSSMSHLNAESFNYQFLSGAV